MNVSIRKSAAVLSIVAIAFAACGGGATTAPSLAASAGTPSAVPSAAATACKVGVAWATFQEERYGLRDEPGIKGAVEAGGGTYVGNDAKLSPETQASNVEALLAANVNVIVINAQDPVAILPSVQKAVDAGIPVIAYDRELENAKALFMTHDNVEVGRIIARAVTAAAPTGNYAIIKGELGQTNPIFLRKGFEEIIAPLIASGAIKIPAGAEVNTKGWVPATAQSEMEQILTANNDNIQAVLSENDGMATGVVAALHGNVGGTVKIGGQDADKAALNRVALGTQVITRLEGRHRARQGSRRGRPPAVPGPRYHEGDRRRGVHDVPAALPARPFCSRPLASPRTTFRSSWTPSGSPRRSSARASRRVPSPVARSPSLNPESLRRPALATNATQGVPISF